MPEHKRWIKLGILLGLIITAAVMYYLLYVEFTHISLEDLQARIESYGAWAPLVFVLFLQVRSLLMVPLAVLTTLAGVVWGWAGFLYMMTGLSLCMFLQFVLARYVAHDAAQRLIRGRLDFIDRYLARNAFWTIFLLRLIPNIVLDVQNVGLALTKVRFRDYFTASFLGVIPGTLVHVGLGHALPRIRTDPRLWAEFALALVLLAGLMWTQHIVRRRMALKSGDTIRISNK